MQQIVDEGDDERNDARQKTAQIPPGTEGHASGLEGDGSAGHDGSAPHDPADARLLETEQAPPKKLRGLERAQAAEDELASRGNYRVVSPLAALTPTAARLPGVHGILSQRRLANVSDQLSNDWRGSIF